MGEYLIIGPSKAGKTALLATLGHAGRMSRSQQLSYEVELQNLNDNMARLESKAQKAVEDCEIPIPATDHLQEFSFDLRVRRSGFWGKLRRPAFGSWKVWDGPGGVLFPMASEQTGNEDYQEHEEFRNGLIKGLSRAQGFILCIDASADTSEWAASGPIGAMFEHIPSIMNATGLTELPAKRVCICLTKVDSLFMALNHGAEQRALTTNPREFAMNKLLPIAVRACLRQYMPRAEIAFGWTSVYGFRDGRPNYDPDSVGFLHHAGDTRKTLSDAWRPFRVLDPLVYLMTGMRCELDVIKAKNLE